MKPLLEAGKVFIALPPLYKVSKGQAKKKSLNMLGVMMTSRMQLKKLAEAIFFNAIKDLEK
jgi:topoisomerase-4 subunit B